MRQGLFSNDMVKMLSQPVPRYTSYPTAPHFKKDFSADTYNDWLYNLDTSAPISLYFHIPFCEKMCWYCGCHTQITQRHDLIEKYIHALIQEITLASDKLPHKLQVCHVHFGGGTPNIVPPHFFKKLMKAIHQKFDLTDDAELAIELDPRTLTDNFIDMLGAEDFTRASLGIQDFDLTVQEAINRVQPFATVQEKLLRLRSVGVNAINFDLIYGLPHQTEQTISETLRKTAFLQPDRLSVFGYAHVPWMKSHQKMVAQSPLPDSKTRLSLFDQICTGLQDLNYKMIGIDHFAKASDPLYQASQDKKLHRNFQGYTTDPAKILLGFGASAIGQTDKGFIQNTVAIGDYQKQVMDGKLPVTRGLEVTDQDRCRAAIIEQIMCYGEVDLPEVIADTAVSDISLHDALEKLDPYLYEGFVDLSDDEFLSLTDPKTAPYFSRLVASCFDQYFKPMATRHSKAI